MEGVDWPYRMPCPWTWYFRFHFLLKKKQCRDRWARNKKHLKEPESRDRTFWQWGTTDDNGRRREKTCRRWCKGLSAMESSFPRVPFCRAVLYCPVCIGNSVDMPHASCLMTISWREICYYRTQEVRCSLSFGSLRLRLAWSLGPRNPHGFRRFGKLGLGRARHQGRAQEATSWTRIMSTKERGQDSTQQSKQAGTQQ
jgi:hypothetical protein